MTCLSRSEVELRCVQDASDFHFSMKVQLWMVLIGLLRTPHAFIKPPFVRQLSRTVTKVNMTKVKSTVNTLQQTVRKSVTIAESSRGYAFKTGPGEYAAHDKFLGVTNPTIRTIAKDHKERTLPELQVLLESEYNEERFLALVILTEQYKKADPEKAETLYQFYLSNMKHVNNWNLVDTSAHLIVGVHLADKNRDILTTLAKSDVLWERRIAMVSTWMFIRNKDYEWTYKLAEMLLHDEHDLMHKAVGWMLREAGKKDVSQLLAFLDRFGAVMPRTMLRYSLEKLTPAQKKHYMALRKA